MVNKKENQQPKREKMVSIYDPTVDAFREVPVSLARKFVKSAKEVEKQLEKEKNE